MLVPSVNESSGLSPLAIINVERSGKWDTESFSSFALRLADANGVPRCVMYRQRSFPEGKCPVKLPSGLYGVNNVASSPAGYELALGLAAATKTPALCCFSYFRPKSRVNLTRFTVPFQRWCPQCLAEKPYGRAIWDLSLVTACPTHRTKLVAQCDCQRRLLLSAGDVLADCCHHCGQKLSAMTAEPAEPGECQIADELGKIVAAASTGAIAWESISPMQQLLEIAERHNARTCSEIAAFYGDPVSCMSRMLESTAWRPPAGKPGPRRSKEREAECNLKRAIIYCFRRGISPSKLLRGEYCGPGDLPPVPIGKAEAVTGLSDADFDRMVLNHPVARGELPYPGIEVWAEQMRVSPERVKKRHAGLVERLKAARSSAKAAAREARWKEFERDVAHAIGETIRLHGRLTYETFYRCLPQPGRALLKKYYRHIKQEMAKAKEQLAAGTWPPNGGAPVAPR